ncbi:MAG: prephenate dehydrogenase/arogenate dehydrogenase family protein [Segatella oris]
MLEHLSNRLQKQMNITLTWTHQALEELSDKGYEPQFGARPLRRLITHTVETALSRDIISDIASVKTGLKAFYEESGHPYVSTHPMFGPTFANLNQLSEENAIIISEGDYMGRIFFKDLYQRLGLNIYEYSFQEHDETVAYSLSIPFVSTFVFAAVMKHQDAPGTTFKRHMQIAKGVLNEDDYLLQEILFNPYTSGQVVQIRQALKELIDIIDRKDATAMKDFLMRIRNHVKDDIV